MNAPRMCNKIMTLLAGLGLSLQVTHAQAISPKLAAEIRAQGQQALASISADQLADLRHRSLAQLTAANLVPRPGPIDVVANKVKLQRSPAHSSLQE